VELTDEYHHFQVPEETGDFASIDTNKNSEAGRKRKRKDQVS
jgi:hypothetical protein